MIKHQRAVHRPEQRQQCPHGTEYRDSLSAGPWVELERRFGLGGLEMVTDPQAPSATRFYRVRVLFAP